MNYDKIIGSAYSWISLSRVVWFLVFFWISLPLLLFLPPAIEQYQLFGSSSIWLVTALYDILYLAVILGVITLTQHCLEERRLTVAKCSVTKAVSIVGLVFVEAFYALVWNLSYQFRIIQVLLLIATGLLYYYYTLLQTPFVQALFALCATAYFIVVVYNVIRLFFSTSFFCNKDLGIVESVKESWAVTHDKFYEASTAIILSLILVFVLFSFSVIVLGTITSLVLSIFLINPLALSVGFRAAAIFALAPAIIAYHYAMAEVYIQLNFHKESSNSIKRILAHKVLSPVRKFAAKKAAPARKSSAPVRKLAKKKRK
ncbi:MAG: hypothetical protein WCW44_04430 [archaeon]